MTKMTRDRPVTSFAPADFLDTPERVRESVRQTLEEEGLEGLKQALGVIARTKGKQVIAEQTGLSRQNLCKALSEEADPRFSTVQKVKDGHACAGRRHVWQQTGTPGMGEGMAGRPAGKKGHLQGGP